MRLSADVAALVQNVLGKIPRLLALQDRDPDAPMRGSLHPAWWRDKSSEVADMRRQEAALTFAWVWRHPFPDNRFQGDPELLHAALRAMAFWTRMQHRDGTFDEWYKNEHGYATTAFSGYAMALAVEALGEALVDPLRSAVLKGLRKAGDWLATHDDWFKTNHQAVGVASLGAIGRVLGHPPHLEAARRNAREIVRRMHEEGWSREISGLDLGYTFLLAEYLGMHAVLTGETEFVGDIARAYRFAAAFLHPDLTTGAEYGICANPYFSRVATVVLAPHDAVAAGVHGWMQRTPPKPRDVSATLEDDLRLARYAYQPLLAALLESGVIERRDRAAAPIIAAEAPFLPEDTRYWPHAQLMRLIRTGHASFVSPAGGGLVRMAFRDGEGDFLPTVLDRGFAIEEGPAVLRNARYALKVEAALAGATATIEAPLVRAGFVMPPYWARVALHLATSLPGGPKWTRKAIDVWRRRKGTALNQSSAGVSAGLARVRLVREVTAEAFEVRITDRLIAREGQLDPRAIHAVVDGQPEVLGGPQPNEDRRIPFAAIHGAPREQAAEFALVRRYRRSARRVQLALEISPARG